LGFKTAMKERLIGIDVLLPSEPTPPGPLIRRYTLDYGQPGQFNKSLLRTLTQVGTDGVTTFNQHTFSYFDDVGGNGIFNPATPINAFGGTNGVAVVPGATTTSGSRFVSDQSGSAFSGEANATSQTHLYTGVGLLKEVSAGAKIGAETGNGKVSLILVDLNG